MTENNNPCICEACNILRELRNFKGSKPMLKAIKYCLKCSCTYPYIKEK